MVSIVVTFGMIALLFISGKVFESLKRLLTLLIDISLKVLNFFGLTLSRKEKRVKVSKQFKETFKDIKIVKQSKENKKILSSIHIPALCILILSLVLIIINLQVVSGNAISIWLFENNPVPMFISTQRNMDVTFTSVLFSFISFSLAKLHTRWSDTKKYRVINKTLKNKAKIIATLSSKELLDAAREKDNEQYKNLLKEDKK